MEKKKCPICDDQMNLFQRYPNMICYKCADKTFTEKGEKIDFYNIDFSGGFYSLVNNIKDNIHECYVNGIKCYAEEDRFGGIVIQLSQ